MLLCRCVVVLLCRCVVVLLCCCVVVLPCCFVAVLLCLDSRVLCRVFRCVHFGAGTGQTTMRGVDVRQRQLTAVLNLNSYREGTRATIASTKKKLNEGPLVFVLRLAKKSRDAQRHSFVIGRRYIDAPFCKRALRDACNRNSKRKSPRPTDET